MKQWRTISLPPWRIDAKRLIQICSSQFELRVTENPAGKLIFEVYCATDDDLATAESFVHQVSADEVLRAEIHRRSGHEIEVLIDSILTRAAGK